MKPLSYRTPRQIMDLGVQALGEKLGPGGAVQFITPYEKGHEMTLGFVAHCTASPVRMQSEIVVAGISSRAIPFFPWIALCPVLL